MADVTVDYVTEGEGPRSWEMFMSQAFASLMEIVGRICDTLYVMNRLTSPFRPR